MTAVAAPHPFVPTPLPIRRAHAETHDTFTLELDASALPGGFPFAPGQYDMLYLFGFGEVPISISGDPARPEKLVHTIRAVGEVTRAMQELKKGAVLGVRGPYGRGWPLDSAKGRDVVLVAGGLGLAPLRSAIYTLLARRKEFGQVAIVYGARSPEELVYRSELEKWAARADVQLVVTVDRAGPEWTGHIGVVTAVLHRLAFPLPNAESFICGPEVMMRFTARELVSLGMSPERIHVSLERNMKCGLRMCGHCQLGPTLVCEDGPVYPLTKVEALLTRREL